MPNPLNWIERKKERETDNSENFSTCISFGDKIETKFLRKSEILSTAPNEKSQVEFLMGWSNHGKKNKGIFYSRLSLLYKLWRG